MPVNLWLSREHQISEQYRDIYIYFFIYIFIYFFSWLVRYLFVSSLFIFLKAVSRHIFTEDISNKKLKRTS